MAYPPDPRPGDLLSAVVVDQLRFATASERIGCAIVAMKLPLELIANLVADEPELAPEVAAAIQNLDEATQALARAHLFLRSRLDVNNARAFGRVNPHEGDTPT